jgi:valyl-tRNA synthetase
MTRVGYLETISSYLMAKFVTDDYECGKRHNLELITMLSPEGAINDNGAPFTGMMRYDARMAIEAALKEKVRDNC